MGRSATHSYLKEITHNLDHAKIRAMEMDCSKTAARVKKEKRLGRAPESLSGSRTSAPT